MDDKRLHELAGTSLEEPKFKELQQHLPTDTDPSSVQHSVSCRQRVGSFLMPFSAQIAVECYRIIIELRL